MKRIACISFFLALFLQGFCQMTPEQENTVDSLKNIIKTAPHDTTRIKAYKAWDDIIYIYDIKLDEELNRKIVGLAENNLKKRAAGAEKRAYEKALVAAYNALGIIAMNQGDLKRSLELQDKTYRLAESIHDKRGAANSLNNIGTIYEQKGDLPKAIDYFTRCLKVREEMGDSLAGATTLNNIGVIYYDIGDFKKALEYHQRSLRIREANNDKAGIAMSLNNIGSATHSLKQLDKAIDYFKRSLEIRRELGDVQALSVSLNNIGAIYQEKGDFESAMIYFQQSLDVVKDVEYSHQIAMTLNNIGNVYYMQGKYEKAYEYNKKAMIAAKKSSSGLMIKDAANSLFKYHMIKKNYKDALEMYQLYITMRDSLQNDVKEKDVMRQEMEYNFEKQKALNEKEHEKQLAVSAEQEQKQRIIALAAAAGLLLVAVFALFVFSRLKVTRKQKNIIEKQKHIVEEKQKEVLDSITYAKRLQDAILPKEQFVKEMLPESFILYLPKDIVAGDFYWLEAVRYEIGDMRGEIKNDEVSNLTSQYSDLILIAAADCTGHGVPGAMVSVVCSNALNRAVLEFKLRDPGKILDKTRELVLETFSKSDADVKDGMDISLASIDRSTGLIRWAGANNPLWYISNGEMKEITANKQPIGKTDDPQPFITHELTLVKGDFLFLFTDGYADQFGLSAETKTKADTIINNPASTEDEIGFARATLIKGKKFKYASLQKLLTENKNSPPETIRHKLEMEFNNWKGNLDQVDDICIVGIKI